MEDIGSETVLLKLLRRRRSPFVCGVLTFMLYRKIYFVQLPQDRFFTKNTTIVNEKKQGHNMKISEMQITRK